MEVLPSISYNTIKQLLQQHAGIKLKCLLLGGLCTKLKGADPHFKKKNPPPLHLIVMRVTL